MQGLRKREDLKFERYFQLVQREARKRGCVYFADAGQGRDLVTEEFEAEDLSGWLIPEEKADEFEPLWIHGDNVPDPWYDYYCWAEWDNRDGLRIQFVYYG